VKQLGLADNDTDQESYAWAETAEVEACTFDVAEVVLVAAVGATSVADDTFHTPLGLPKQFVVLQRSSSAHA